MSTQRKEWPRSHIIFPFNHWLPPWYLSSLPPSIPLPSHSLSPPHFIFLLTRMSKPTKLISVIELGCVSYCWQRPLWRPVLFTLADHFYILPCKNKGILFLHKSYSVPWIIFEGDFHFLFFHTNAKSPSQDGIRWVYLKIPKSTSINRQSKSLFR